MPSAHGYDIEPTSQGVIFALSEGARRDRRQTFGPWEARLSEDNAYVCVVRQHPDLNESLSSVVNSAHDVAQRFLDIVAVDERHPLLVSDPHDNVVWRDGPRGLKLQLNSSITFSPRFKVSPILLDANGDPLPAPQFVPPQYHHAYRFYRYSQAAHNLLDAYRNIFLALEAILDRVEPQIPPEGEKDWLRRALNTAINARGLSLAAFSGSGGGDPVGRFLIAHYKAVRCATFHAKASAGRAIIPGSIPDHDLVTHQLLAVQDLVEHLLISVFSTRLPVDRIHPDNFDSSLSDISKISVLLFSASGTPTVEGLGAADDSRVTDWSLVSYKGRQRTGWDEFTFISDISPQKLVFSKVASLRFYVKPGLYFPLSFIADWMESDIIRTDLDLNGANKFVASIRIILNNARSPRTRFSC